MVMWPWEKFTVIFTDHIRQVRLFLTHKPPRTSDDISIIFLKPPVADTFQYIYTFQNYNCDTIWAID